MKKIQFLLVALLLFLSQFVFAGTQRQWKLLSSDNGIEFYISEMDLDDGKTKTLLKIKNTNEEASKVSFYAIFPCIGNQTREQAEMAFLNAGEIAIYTYQVCEIEAGKGFDLRSVQVVRQ